MMGIPVNNHVFTYGDNQIMLWDTTVTDSTLKNESSAVAFHFVREDVLRKECITGYIKNS